MTFRLIKSVMPVALVAIATGCSRLASPNHPVKDSAAGAVAATSDTLGPKLPTNHTGRIPVLEYHVIGGDKNALYTRTAASFKADLEDVYKRGYRPITIAQMLDKDWSDAQPDFRAAATSFDASTS